MSFDPQLLLNILRCTRTRGRLIHEGNSLVCTDPDCRLRYAIDDGIPNMLAEEAVSLGVEEWQALMRKHGRDPKLESPRSA